MKLSRLTRTAAALLLAVAVLPAHAELKVGYLNTIALMQNAPQARVVQERMQKEFEPRAKELTAKGEKLQKSLEDFQKNSLLLSEDQRKKKERDLLSQQREFKNDKEAFEEDSRLRQKEELGVLQGQIMAAVDKFGKANGYQLIVTEGVVFASTDMDITEQVLTVLKSLK